MDTKLPSVTDEQLALHAAATLAATENGTPLDMGTGWAPALGGLPMQALIPVTSIKTSAGNETYTVAIQDSPDNSSWTTRVGPVTIAAAGMVQLGFFNQGEYIRTVFTLGGTSPSLVIGESYVTPQVLG